jgi:MYXO-CTERM domain-containing protein
MNSARGCHTATLLPDGRVLVAGGSGAGGFLASAEIFDPATGVWTSAGTMTSPRAFHTATLLPDGRVLVVGGIRIPAGAPVDSAELYDPASDTWTPTSTPMSDRRSDHTATLLSDGTVLIAGGHTPNNYSAAFDALQSAEVYVPAEDSWVDVEPMRSTRAGHTATLLQDGRVLVAGGEFLEGYMPGRGVYNQTRTLAEVYDARTSSFAPVDSMNVERFDHTATLLPGGGVLVAGGESSSNTSARAEIYDAAPSSSVCEPGLCVEPPASPSQRHGVSCAVTPSAPERSPAPWLLALLALVRRRRLLD